MTVGANIYGSFYGEEQFIRSCYGATCLRDGGQWALIVPTSIPTPVVPRVKKIQSKQRKEVKPPSL